MDKSAPSYSDFLNAVDPRLHQFVEHAHRLLLENGCKHKIERAQNGYLLSYSHKPTKRVIVNFVFRKSGLVIRIYADFCDRYTDFLETLPEDMLQKVDKAPSCKRLLDITKCSSRCPMGYDFWLGDSHYQKCRYNCFLLPVCDENTPFLERFLARELRERAASTC